MIVICSIDLVTHDEMSVHNNTYCLIITWSQTLSPLIVKFLKSILVNEYHIALLVLSQLGVRKEIRIRRKEKRGRGGVGGRGGGGTKH